MSSQATVHSSEFYKEEWVLARQSIHADGLIVEHHIETADEIEAPPLAQHVITLLLNSDSQRQVTRFDAQEFDGVQHGGDMWMIGAGRSGHFCWDGTDEVLLFIVKPAFLSLIAAETNGIRSEVELLSTVHAHDSTLLSLALSFQQEMQQSRWGDRLYTESLANLFGIHLLRNYCSQQPKLREYEDGLPAYKLKQVRDFICDHLDQDIKLVQLAETVGMSRYYFIKLFKQSTGITPHQYLLQQRVQRAQELLGQQRGMSIAEIALQCGFANQSHFTKHFRQFVGTTPKAYRDQVL